jgi:hypothetical protein
MSVIICILSLIVGITAGWFFADKYRELVEVESHEFDELFENNPHPELYDKNGKLHRGDYMLINFELGYDPSEFDSEDIMEE